MCRGLHFACDVPWQGLKPDLFQFVYGPTKEAAEKFESGQERRTSGAKARRILNPLRPD